MNISEAKVVVFENVISEATFLNVFNLEKSSTELQSVFSENDLDNTCKSKSDIVDYRNLLLSIRVVAAKTSTSLVQANRTVGNLFRDELAAALRAEGRTVNTEVFKKTPFGPRYMDLDFGIMGLIWVE